MKNSRIEIIDTAIMFASENALCVSFTIVSGCFMTYFILKPILQERRDRKRTIELKHDSDRTAQLQEKMEQIRLLQQKKTNDISIEKEKLRKDKIQKENQRKYEETSVIQNDSNKGGRRLGGDDGGTNVSNGVERPRRRQQQQSGSNRYSSRPPPIPNMFESNINTIAGLDHSSYEQQPTTFDSDGGSGGLNNSSRNWNTQGTTFVTPEDRWARVERSAQRNRSSGPRPQPGNAPSSRGNWGR